jgi:hypothetical protein
METRSKPGPTSTRVYQRCRMHLGRARAQCLSLTSVQPLPAQPVPSGDERFRGPVVTNTRSEMCVPALFGGADTCFVILFKHLVEEIGVHHERTSSIVSGGAVAPNELT